MKLNTRKSFAAAALLGLGLAGCDLVSDETRIEDYAQRLLQDFENGQSPVDTHHEDYAQRLLQDFGNDQSLVGTHHDVEASEPDLAHAINSAITVKDVEDVAETNSICIDYRAFESIVDTKTYRQFSWSGRACIPN